MIDYLQSLALGIAAAAFLIGMGITALTGRATGVKGFLVLLAVLVLAVAIALLVISPTLFALSLFQLIGGLLVLGCFVIAGAACGGGVYALLHRKPAGKALDASELASFLPLDEFCRLEGIDPERARSRIQSGFYQGGLHGGGWYVHRSELSSHSTAT